MSSTFVGAHFFADKVGNVRGSDCIVVTDIVDTGLTLARTAATLKANGARKVYAYGSHGLFSGQASDVLKNCKELEEVVVSNTAPLSDDVRANPKIRQVSLGPLLAEAIRRVHLNQSISSLFTVPARPTREKK